MKSKLITYLFQIFEILLVRREEFQNKLHCPHVLELEDTYRRDLSVLRALVAREYCVILFGTNNLNQSDMSNKENPSSTEQEMRIYEPLYRISVTALYLSFIFLFSINNEKNKLLQWYILSISVNFNAC
jgi:hypothetical protein